MSSDASLRDMAPPDLGLADVDFGPGPVTMLGLCQLDPAELVAAANAEAVGLWAELEAFCSARKAAHAAALNDQQGGPSDPVGAFEAEQAAELAAAQAEPDPATRAAAALLASGGDGRDPLRGFPEWEKDVLAARLGISTGQAKRLCRTAVALRDRLPATAAALSAGAISWAHADRLAEHTGDLTVEQSGVVERSVLADGRMVTPRQYENRARKLASAYSPAPGPDDEGESVPAPSLVAAQTPGAASNSRSRSPTRAGGSSPPPSTPSATRPGPATSAWWRSAAPTPSSSCAPGGSRPGTPRRA